VSRTHEGIREMEEVLDAPKRRPTTSGPMVNITTIHGSLIGSQIQQGSLGASQSGTFSIGRAGVLCRWRAERVGEAAWLHSHRRAVCARGQSIGPGGSVPCKRAIRRSSDRGAGVRGGIGEP